MRMPNIAVLPALFTLGNAICGVAAIGILLKAPHLDLTGPDLAGQAAPFLTSGLLVMLAMVFDALDGRIARFARATTDFGEQLDSLSDAVSFGAAPALLAYRLFVDVVADPAFHRLTLVLGAVYVACALLRLARFNVENVHGMHAHLSFRGLPSPAAAGAVAGLVVLVANFWQDGLYPAFATAVVWAMPAVLLVLAMLMVSNIRYSHVMNQLVRGRRPMSYILQVLICIALVWFLQEKVLALLFIGYVVSGPAVMVYHRFVPSVRHAGRSAAIDAPEGDEDSPRI